MSKVYVSKISVYDQLEIMKMAIANKDVVNIRKMVRDGYTVSLPLLEMFYRFLGKDNLVSIVNASYEDFRNKPDCVAFLQEVLVKKQFEGVMASNLEMLEKKKNDQAKAAQEEVREYVKAALAKYGHTRTFYANMLLSNDAFKCLIEMFGEDELFKRFEEFGLIKTVDNIDSGFYLRCFSFEFLYQNNIKAAAIWLIQKGIDGGIDGGIQNYKNVLVDVAEKGGLECFIKYANSWIMRILFEDAGLREKAKSYGRLAYRKLYYYAPQSYFTLEDWYNWYKVDPKEALKRCHDCKVPRLWLVKHKHFFHALGLR